MKLNEIQQIVGSPLTHHGMPNYIQKNLGCSGIGGDSVQC